MGLALDRLFRKIEQNRETILAKMGTTPAIAATTPISIMPAALVVSSSDVDRLPAVRVVPKKNAYAIVIGIEQYREKLPKADFADKDARLMGEYLTKVLGYPEENVIVRLNERATRTDMVKYFEEWLKNNVEPGGSVFVYYSGHGAPNTKTGEAYLVPYDGDPSFVDSMAYPVKQMYAALDKLPAKDVTVVLDSCFSGAGGRSVLAKGARPMGLSIENQVLATGKTVVLAASGGDQISNSFEEKGHGLLTYFFLKGLQGDGDTNKDGAIEMVELYDYVKPNVQRIARKQYNNEQTPQLLASPDVLKKGGGRLV
ncbi:MAG: caspase family protein [Nitrospiraceae bacterium]|nr:caspase family protein [Nitrospiraceae bacterium]MSR23763.1 caspase family protein [Nitrospiraceae bacterium]